MTTRTGTRTRTRTGARTAPRPGARAPRPPRGQEHAGFPPAVFDIPDQWWSDTATPQTEVTRARRRAAIKRYARTVWHEAVTHGRAWKVDRYIACIAVAYPHDRDTFPAQAAETVKPIIDAGTEYGLWPDDDSTHRCATIYFRAPGHAPAHRHRLTVFIIPVPSRPAYVVSRDLNQTIIDAARDRGQAYRAASLQFTVPFGLWVTSNITDSDILARQHGHRKASTWGGRRAQGVRERTIGTLRSMGADKWRRTGASLTGTPFVTFAGIRYATDRDADPDNAAETVDALMRAGADAGCIDGVSGTQCKATVFFRLKGKAAPSEHDVKLYAVAIPDGTQWLDLLLDSCDRAWRRGGAR